MIEALMDPERGTARRLPDAAAGPAAHGLDQPNRPHSPFCAQLLEVMHDGVVFVGGDLQILTWNRALERLTGIAAGSVLGQTWPAGGLRFRDENYRLVGADRCPIVRAVRCGVSTKGRFLLMVAGREKLAVDVCGSPVFSAEGKICGATLVVHDASSRVSLEERLQSLNAKATQDGLTGVANRAELDETHEQWFEWHQEQGRPYSLMICDLDHFKRINDTFGHQVGDEVLVAFAALLRKFCRADDLVARYGGEEFVMLCRDCDLATAAVRAENIREAWCRQPQPMLGGEHSTASFGVTELQSDDAAEQMLKRADRALFQAKNEGRNTVVQLGMTVCRPADRSWFRRWLAWWTKPPGRYLVRRRLVTAVPLQLAKQKVRGFITDYEAAILEVSEERVRLQIDGRHVPLMRRHSDHPTPFIIELHFEEARCETQQRVGSKDPHTHVHVGIRCKRDRNQRHPDADARAQQLLYSLKSYLMAHQGAE